MGFNNSSHGGWNDKYPDGTPIKKPIKKPNEKPDNEVPQEDEDIIDNEQTGGSKMQQNETTFETGMDEQAKQASMQNITEKVLGHDQRNDRSSDFYEQLRQQKLDHERRLQEIELASKELRIREQEQALSERRQIAFNTDLANKQALRHENYGFDKLTNLEAVEAVANDTVFNGDFRQSMKSIMLEVMREIK